MRAKNSMKIGGMACVMGMLLAAAGVAVAGSTYCVWTNGTPNPPYDNWSNCFTNIQAAVNYASGSDTVLVSNGVYTVTQAVSIAKGVTVKSALGATVTTISLQLPPGVSDCVARVTFSNAVLDGFTIQNGSNTAANAKGGGVYVALTGTVQNCVIVNNKGYYGGGAYVESNGVVRNCQILSNKCYQGGGAYLLAGTVSGCTIIGNDSTYLANEGGGVFMANAGSLVRNCLIRGNKAQRYGGGIYLNIAGATVENCTVVENINGMPYAGGGVYQSAGTVRNTIVWNNTSPQSWLHSPNWYLSGGTASNCCSPSYWLPAGSGNTAANPRFRDRTAGDFRLSPGSPCIDAGTNGVGGATDLDGNNRTNNGVVDMGAYEFTPTALQCSLWTTNQLGTIPYMGLATFTNVFVASVAGTNTSSLYYKWDFNNDGTVDLQGANLATVTNDGANAYANCGYYSVALTVTNAAGETATCVRTNFIRVGPVTAYVRMPPGGTPTAPFTSWANAATNILNAVSIAVDGTTVVVTNGVYTNSATIYLTNNITLKSVNGKDVTTLYGTGGNSVVGTGFLSLGSGGGLASTDGETGPTNASVQGFTIKPSGIQGAVLFGGSISDCQITNCSISDAAANLVLAGGARADRCTVAGNTTAGRSVPGILMYTPVYTPAYTSIVDHCVVMNNRQVSASMAGNGSYWMACAGVAMCSISPGNPVYAVVRNSLIANNYTATNRANVECWGGTIENCTIVGNTNGALSADVPNAVGGLWLTNSYAATPAVVRNCILWGNTNTTTGLADNYRRDGGTIQYTCATPDASAYGSGNTTATPGFVGTGAVTNYYRLAAGSPCINTGTNVLSWMTGALDLAGNARIQGKTVDMGAYESKPTAGTSIYFR